MNNTATADSDEVVPVTDSDDVQIVESVTLVIAKDFSNPGNDGPPTNDLPEETVTAGGPAGTFYITVTNTGLSTADNVTITDLVPAVLTVSNVTGTAGVEVANPTLDDNNISWLLTSLAPNASVTLTVTYSVGAGVVAQLVNNTATADSDEVVPVSDSDDVQIVESVTLVIAKDFSNPGNDGPPTNDLPEETVTAGGPAGTFYITVTNTGLSTADNVTITDLVPAVLTVSNVTGTAGVEVANPTLDDNNISWLLSSLAPNASVTLTVTYSVAAGVDAQLVNNTATADSDEVVPVSDSDDVQIVESVTLVIAKDFSNPANDGPPTNDLPEETVTAGGPAGTFYIKVTNTGLSTADNVTITDLVPAVLTVSNVTGTAGVEVANPTLDDNNISWLLTSLAPNASVTLTVTYSVAAGVDAQLVNNTATADSDEVVPVSDSDDVQIVESVTLVIAKDFSNPANDGPPTNDLPEETVTAGGPAGTFYITVTNTGLSTADNVTITDLVPAVLTVSNVTGTAGVEVANPTLDDNNISWLLTSLAPNASVTLTVTYSVAAGVDAQLVNNTATADSDEVVPVSDSDDVQIVESVTLVIAKDFSNPGNDGPPTNDLPEETVTAGGPAGTFYITVTNTGLSTADNVTITDLVPRGPDGEQRDRHGGRRSGQSDAGRQQHFLAADQLGAQCLGHPDGDLQRGGRRSCSVGENTATADSDEVVPVKRRRRRADRGVGDADDRQGLFQSGQRWPADERSAGRDGDGGRTGRDVLHQGDQHGSVDGGQRDDHRPGAGGPDGEQRDRHGGRRSGQSDAG